MFVESLKNPIINLVCYQIGDNVEIRYKPSKPWYQVNISARIGIAFKGNAKGLHSINYSAVVACKRFRKP